MSSAGSLRRLLLGLRVRGIILLISKRGGDAVEAGKSKAIL